MNPNSQMSNSSSAADPPLKRKRGRPRKDESLVQPETVVPPVPIVDSLKRNKQCADTTDTTSAIDNEMVGQVVSGVIEGSFEAGYLLKVKVGDNDTHLRGVVFLPGTFAPLTPSNDVAPEVKMYKRTEMPIPVQSPPAADQCDKQATEAQNFTPMLDVRVEGLTSELQSSIPIASENQQVAAVLPLTDNLPRMSSAGSSFGGPQQILETGLGSSSALPRIGHEKVVEHDDLLKAFEASLTKVANANAAAATEQSKSTPTPPSIGRSPDRTVNLELQIQHQAVDDDLKPQNAPEHGVKTQNIEHNQALISAETLGIANWMEKPEPAPPELQNIAISEASKVNGKPESHADNNAEAESTSAPITSLPVTLFDREPMTSAPKTNTEGSILQMMIQPQLCISSGTESIMKVNVDSAPVTSLNVSLFERADNPPSESKLVSDKPEPQNRFCSSSGIGEARDSASTNRIVGD
ncbi:uncharacterized protein [Euphorbia lathyris]|uniref:uncharacterized protein n=1 Tax=Euphorbia lathyris TaxID=212925 RepID=UPI0033139B07